MALIMFLFGSVLGVIGAALQLTLGFGFSAALQTYAFVAIGLPTATIMAYGFRQLDS